MLNESAYILQPVHLTRGCRIFKCVYNDKRGDTAIEINARSLLFIHARYDDSPWFVTAFLLLRCGIVDQTGPT